MSSRTTIPAVIDALVQLATTAFEADLPDVLVLDGFGDTDDPGDYLMIGVEDPDSDQAARTADSRQSWRTVGYDIADEEGDVTCAAVSWNGDADQKVARDAAFAMVDALFSAIQTDPSIGIPSLLWTRPGASIEFTQSQTDDGGALAMVIFRVHFAAQIVP